MSIADIRVLGYEVGIASGGVAVEEAALAEASAAAQPGQVRLDAEPIIAKATSDFATLAKAEPWFQQMSEAEQTNVIADFMTRITAQTLRMLQQQRDERAEFHGRAVAIAKTMPTTFVIEGFGTRTYLPFTDDTGKTPSDAECAAACAALVDSAAHAERRFQHEHPDADRARRELEEKGYAVVRPDPSIDVFDVKERGTGTVVAPRRNPPDLPPLAETLPPLA